MNVSQEDEEKVPRLMMISKNMISVKPESPMSQHKGPIVSDNKISFKCKPLSANVDYFTLI